MCDNCFGINPLDPPPVKNVPLARKVMEFIREHRNQHNQSVWSSKRDVFDVQKGRYLNSSELALDTECGTTACFAGWACVLNGDLTYADEKVVVSGKRGEADAVLESIPQRAVDVLGLTANEAARLFYADDFDELEYRVEVVFGERL